MKFYNVFATEIWVTNSAPLDNDKLAEIILEKEKTEETESHSNIGGWHSKDLLHTGSEFDKLWEYIFKSFDEVVKHNNYKENIEIKLDNAWAIVNRYKDFNKEHDHPLTNWSCAYYVKVPENSGGINFIDPRTSKKMLYEESLMKNFDNLGQCPALKIMPEMGMLLIFPAYVRHYVDPNGTDEPRICISSNISLRLNI